MMCAETGCTGEIKSRGLCNLHYHRARRSGDIDVATRSEDGLPALRVDRWWAPTQPTPCMTTDPELWFPEKGQDGKDAKALCAGCPELDACADWAAQVKPSHGIWAGQSWSNGRTRHRTDNQGEGIA